jgi:hypothetical protein
MARTLICARRESLSRAFSHYFVKRSVWSAVVVAIGLTVSVIESQAQCTDYKFVNGKAAIISVPCRYGGSSGGGSSGGGGNNNAAALDAAGAALGLLGTVIENVERRQQERANQAAQQRAQAARERNRVCANNQKQGGYHNDMGNSLRDQDPETAIKWYNRAIEYLTPCRDSENIKRVRQNLARARNALKDLRTAEESENEADEQFARGKAEEERLARVRADEEKLYKARVAANDPVRLKRTQELAFLGEMYNKILKNPDKSQREALLKKHHEFLVMVINGDRPSAQTGAAGAGPRTCGNVDGKWVCSNDYNDPVFKQSPAVEQK